MIRSYYILYKDITKINYIYLLKLYKIAKSYNNSMVKNTIKYNTLKEIAEKAQINYITLTKILNNIEYKDYILKEEKQIVLNNNFKGKKDIQFVILTEKEVDYLIDNNDNLLAKYFIYHKYYCGFNVKTNRHNSTLKQIIETMGYSSKANNYISQLSKYNKQLEADGMIYIDRYIENGKNRAFYYFA